MSVSDHSQRPMSEDARIEAVACAMWEFLADKQDDRTRSPCFHVPIEPVPGKRLRDAPAQRWDESSGAWRQEMLDMAAVAVATGWMIDA
jgi:hypothetical protein